MATRRRTPRRLRRWISHTDLFPKLEIGSAVLAFVLGLASYAVLAGKGAPASGFSPPTITLLLVLTLVPVMALVVLIARRVVILVSNRRQGRAGARLHLKLVALFAGVAAVPTLLVVAFAALLFQYGVQFWFSARAQTVLENADRVAQAYVVENKQRIVGDIVPMAADIRANAAEFGLTSADFQRSLAFQVAARNLNEAAVFEAGPSGIKVLASVGLDPRPLTARFKPTDVARAVTEKARVLAKPGDRVEAIALVDGAHDRFVYASRRVDAKVLDQAVLSRTALKDYKRLIDRSRALQFRFNALLAVVSLLLLSGAIWAALRLATRLVRPIGRLAAAAERVGEGDLTARVIVSGADEISGLSRAFNRMTSQLGVQQRALLQAGEQIDVRRALTEAVLAGVSAGVLAVDGAGIVRILNASAAELLGLDADRAVGAELTRLAPELAALVDGGDARGEVAIARGAETQTLSVRVVRAGAHDGVVVTFDDISQQLADQRRAAWADVARRIAHEIKNPLTPIQLSAERLQRKFGRQIVEEAETFGALTGTIVRQVGDLRRMVDEFSAFARMPRPEFAPASLAEIAAQAITLQEVAYPGIGFTLDAPPAPPLVCDRRQIAQALTNLLQNAAQSVAARQERDGGEGHVRLSIQPGPGTLALSVADEGLGLPVEQRARLTEPYVTTRARGTGLGLAIVLKIVEDHAATLSLEDAPGGTGAVVTIRFDVAALAARLKPALMAAE